MCCSVASKEVSRMCPYAYGMAIPYISILTLLLVTMTNIKDFLEQGSQMCGSGGVVCYSLIFV